MEKEYINNPLWRDLVLNRRQLNLNFLAAKILLSRIHILISKASPEHEINMACEEIFNIYMKYSEIPSARKDIEMISGEGLFKKS